MKELLESDGTGNITLNKVKNKIFKPSDRIRASALDKVEYFMNQYSDGQCRCVIKFEGQIDSSKLARAVELSLKVVPVLGCRFVYHPWRCFWKRDSPLISDLLFRQVETKDAETETYKFLIETIDYEKDIQVSVCLIRSERDTLCIKLSHMVADAMGFMDYIRILSQLYNKLQSNPCYVPPQPLKSVRGLSQVLRNIRLTVLIKGFYNWSFPKSDWGFPKLNSDFSASSFPVRLVSKERLNSIKTFCHGKGIKFTDVITAAFYQALIDTLEPQPNSQLPIQVTIDLRPYLTSGRAQTICILSSTYYPRIKYTLGRSFDQTLQDVQKAVSAERKGESWLGATVLLEMLNLFPGFIQKMLAKKIIQNEFSSGTSHPNLSNLGVIDPSLIHFSDLRVDDLGLFGPVLFPPSFMTTMYTFKEQLYINSSFCPTATDPKLVDRFFDCFLNYLPE